MCRCQCRPGSLQPGRRAGPVPGQGASLYRSTAALALHSCHVRPCTAPQATAQAQTSISCTLSKHSLFKRSSAGPRLKQMPPTAGQAKNQGRIGMAKQQAATCKSSTCACTHACNLALCRPNRQQASAAHICQCCCSESPRPGHTPAARPPCRATRTAKEGRTAGSVYASRVSRL